MATRFRSTLIDFSTVAHRRHVSRWLAVLLVLLGAASAEAQPQETIEYYATDALGSIRVVFDQAGNVAARSEYLPFGEALAAAGNLPSQRFTGQQRDGDEGLDNFNARSYQTRTGRLTRVDPMFGGLFEPQQLNRYSYVTNNPLSFTDPSGALRAPRPDFRTSVTEFDSVGTWLYWIWTHTDDDNWGGGSSDGGNRGGSYTADGEAAGDQGGDQKRAPDVNPNQPPLVEAPPPKEQPPVNEACEATWTGGTPTVFVGATINLTAIGGGELTTGLYLNLGWGTSRRAFGAFASAGGSVGLNLSGGITFGINKGDHSYLSGDAVEFSGGTEVSGTLIANGTGTAGFSLTAGPAYPVVVSASRTVTTLSQVYTGPAKDCK